MSPIVLWIASALHCVALLAMTTHSLDRLLRTPRVKMINELHRNDYDYLTSEGRIFIVIPLLKNYGGLAMTTKFLAMTMGCITHPNDDEVCHTSYYRAV